MMWLAKDPRDPALGGNVIGGDPQTYHPALWSFLIERYRVASMLDVGCGEGHCVQWFGRCGIEAVGFDGLPANVERAVVPIKLHDLRVGPFVLPVDLVHCCEVVEHIEPTYLENLLQTLASGRVVAMTHAQPGQGGHHHVNCQDAGYWIAHLARYDYQLDPEATQQAKDAIAASGSWTFFQKSGMVFERAARV